MHETLREDFPGPLLDLDVWVPYHAPHWSSRAESAATYEIADGELQLSIPPNQPLWCADSHPEPIRISCIQSGTFSGPVGSTLGPQPFMDGQVVRSEEPTHWGYTPTYGQIEVRMRAEISASSMFAFYLTGIEDRPERSGEICLAEIFGEGIGDDVAAVGIGLKKLGDPKLHEDFLAVRLPLDPAEFHVYSAEWTPEGVVFRVDGDEVRRTDQAPDYPMQVMMGVFDFPARRGLGEADFTPKMVVDHVYGASLR